MRRLLILVALGACTPTQPTTTSSSAPVDQDSYYPKQTVEEPTFISGCAGLRVTGRVGTHVHPYERIRLDTCEQTAWQTRIVLRVSDIGGLLIEPQVVEGTPLWPKRVIVEVQAWSLESTKVSLGDGDAISTTRHGVEIKPVDLFDCDWSDQGKKCAKLDAAFTKEALADSHAIRFGWIDAWRH